MGTALTSLSISDKKKLLEGRSRETTDVEHRVALNTLVSAQLLWPISPLEQSGKGQAGEEWTTTSSPGWHLQAHGS